MSWMQALYETYDACADKIGDVTARGVTLLPIFHTTQQAQIEGAIDMEGNWISGRGRILEDKSERTTVIPCTEKSSSRSGSAVEPHPLFDKLQYVAGDFDQYVNERESGFEKYLKQLEQWCASAYAHPKVKAILRYLCQGTLMEDLANDGLLYRAPDGSIPGEWQGDKKDAPAIFKTVARQWEAFVRLRIFGGDGRQVWNDRMVWDSWIEYQKSLETNLDYCYATGEQMARSELSPKKIRNAGDSAKLISSNDTSGFTFRGRFATSEEASSVGRVVTEKAHNVLRWLISGQGYINQDQAILAWWISGKPFYGAIIQGDALSVAQRLNNSNELFGEPSKTNLDTGTDFAQKFSSMLRGYKESLEDYERAAVIGLDSATPGRLSVFYYQEIPAKDLIERVHAWHTSCSWIHRYRNVAYGEDKKGKPVLVPVSFIGAPSLKDIAEVAYGSGVSDQLKKKTIERLLPCIINGARLPADIMYRVTVRASNPMGMERWEARKTLSIACALIRKYYNDRNYNKKEGFTMAVDQESCDRSYLFGRALAYARRMEEYAQYKKGDNDLRETNAERMQMAFSQRPARTWKRLIERLEPYIGRLKSDVSAIKTIGFYEGELNEVISRIGISQFNNQPLSPIYLLGYSSQYNEFLKKKIEKGNEEE